MGRSPRVDPPASGVGRPRQHRRPRGEARGYPGDQVAQLVPATGCPNRAEHEMATKKQTAARAKFARQAREKGSSLR